jgi:prophage regulatory protein
MRLLRLEEVMRMTGLKQRTLYRLIAEGKFSKQVRLSARAVAWKENEIRAWIKSRETKEGKE